MTNRLSDWAREFLRGDRVAVVSTLNKDGSPHVTTIWYWLSNDGTLVITTPGSSQKSKNLRGDPRIALCVGDMGRSISLYGRVSIIEDQALVRQDLVRVIERYVKDEGRRPQVVTILLQRAPVALHFFPEKVTEFSGWNMTHT
ncbi:PPOX class F420-dependent enzyme [Dictyobacter alpinus]|uniref:PPOX class F420-dependent enzyme n=1 Tax=Dictyobacter alpinus TaxID=2014873 RepID=A0A402BE67_9CHLR|nr:TIGR03618 family F420-dependent PPOX class oxidoreductase [Dictyobacter alpinus]GCE29731.1 PPOX class F420-dependent enzyme [Dictyobacter alpinus]